MKLIDEFDVSDRVKLKLQVGEYRGDERIDLRQYILVDGEFIASKKGVNLSSEWAEKLINMIEKLKDL